MAKKKPAENKIKKNLLIGLGGTGQKALLEIKRSLITSYGEVPEEVVFLAIDTDRNYDITDPYTEEKIGFENTEFERLKGKGATAVAKSADWWPDGVTDWPLAGAGAAAKRMHGRAKLGLAIRPVADRIQEAVNECRATGEHGPDIADEGGIRVTLVCSLAGGTGAGCWLDVANLVHENIDFEDGDRFWGIMLLGDAFASLPGTKNKYANTCGCLRELQWLLEPGGLSEESRYKKYELNGREMEFPDAEIFSQCFLVTRKTFHNEVIEDTESLVKAIGRFIFHMCGEAAGGEFESRSDNIKEHKLYGRIEKSKKDEYSKKRGVFWSLGISELVLETEMDNELTRANAGDKILKHLINPARSSEGADSDTDNADFFLRKHQLQEREQDDVIDQLFNPSKVVGWQNKRLRPPAENKFEKDSAKKLAVFSKSFCSDRAPNHVRKEGNAVSEKLLKKVSSLLNGKLSETLIGLGGVARAMYFFKNLENELARQRDMMKSEAVDDKETAQARQKEFEKRTRAIPNRQSGLFWRGSVEQDIQRFLPVARDWLRMEVDVCRKEIAATFFSNFRERVLLIVSSLESLEGQIQQARNLLKSKADRLIRRERSNFRVEPPPQEGVLDSLEMAKALTAKVGSKLFKKWLSPECAPDDIAKNVLEFCEQESIGLGSGGIEALVHAMTDETEALVGQVVHRAAPLWTYDGGVVQPGHTEKFCIIVTEGDEEPPPKLKKVLRQEKFVLNKDAAWRPVATANYLTAIRIETHVPAFALDTVRREMMREYKNETIWEECRVGFHLDGRWRQDLPSLEPDKAEEDRKLHWAIATARGIIKIGRSRYEVRNTLGKGTADADGYFWHRLEKSSHQGAKGDLIEDKSLCDNLNEQWIELRKAEGRDAFNAELEVYRRELADTVRNTSGDSDRKNSMDEDVRLLNKFLSSKGS